MNPLNLVIELSDLLESSGYEDKPLAQLFDEEIFPAIRHLGEKADPIGLGDRFGKVLDKVQASLNAHGTDRVRTLKDMMKSSLITYVRATNDAVTAREMYHRAIMSGSDTMLTVTAATILANALSGQHQDEAKMLIQQVASRLSGKQPRIPSMESASGSAVGSGAIAVAAKGMKKKRRRDLIFAEGAMQRLCIDFPLFIRMMEFAREDAKDDLILHKIAERAEQLGQHGKNVLDMNDYNFLIQDNQGHGMAESINEADVTQLGHRTEPVNNPALSDPGNDLSNVHRLPHRGNIIHGGRKHAPPREEGEGGIVYNMKLPNFMYPRKPSRESVSWDDLIGNSTILDILREISEHGESRPHDGIMVDPVTAELVLNVHQSLTKPNQQRYESKSLTEMIKIAHRAVERGLIEVVMQEG